MIAVEKTNTNSVVLLIIEVGSQITYLSTTIPTAFIANLIFVGGVFGIIFGILVSVVVSAVGVRAIGVGGGTMNAVVTPELLIFALVFSVFVGIISGVVPCKNCSKDEPGRCFAF